MNQKQILEYYSRGDVQEFILRMAKNREVVGVFRNGSYSERPGTVVYSKDITSMVSRGIIEFHSSLERWQYPARIGTESHEGTRIGWDLILDVDCKRIEHGRIAASVVIEALSRHGVRNVSVKFTGGSGFHIGIPWESFPKMINYRDSAGLYPEVARQIGHYLKGFIRDDLQAAFIRNFDLEELASDLDMPLGQVFENPFLVADIDSVLLSPRHLFRMPYSINRKTFLVSLPIKPADISGFEPEHAHPSRVRVRGRFLDEYEENEAELLVSEALDWWNMKKGLERQRRRTELRLKSPVTEEFFPPCIKHIKAGLEDGRKRSVFILINFLSSLRWKQEDVERFIHEWNERNRPPLPSSYISGQLRWHRGRKPILPPNCAGDGWYSGFGACMPDNLCGGQEKTIKNPVNYSVRRFLPTLSRARQRGGGKQAGKGRRVK